MDKNVTTYIIFMYTPLSDRYVFLDMTTGEYLCKTFIQDLIRQGIPEEYLKVIRGKNVSLNDLISVGKSKN